MTTNSKFIGSNGKEGVTVYKPINILTIGDGIIEMNKNHKNETKFVKDEVEYEIIKEQINNIYRSEILLNNNTLLVFSKNRELILNSSKELTSEDYKILQCNDIYKIKKVNEKGKVFKFNIIDTNIGVVVNGLLLKNKIKMRMF